MPKTPNDHKRQADVINSAVHVIERTRDAGLLALLPSGAEHCTLPLLVSVQYVVFAAADARLQDLNASHQAQLPSELMRIKRALGLAPPFGEMPHARKADWLRRTSLGVEGPAWTLIVSGKRVGGGLYTTVCIINGICHRRRDFKSSSNQSNWKRCAGFRRGQVPRSRRRFDVRLRDGSNSMVKRKGSARGRVSASAPDWRPRSGWLAVGRPTSDSSYRKGCA
jgi:hypothetical protein